MSYIKEEKVLNKSYTIQAVHAHHNTNMDEQDELNGDTLMHWGKKNKGKSATELTKEHNAKKARQRKMEETWKKTKGAAKGAAEKAKSIYGTFKSKKKKKLQEELKF